MHTRLHQETVRELEPWFHNIHLPDGTQTAPAHFLGDFPAYKWAEIREIFDRDVHGSSILDIGCNAGFYSIKLALRGARVTAVDSNPHYLKQARWASGIFGVKERIEFHQMQIYDLAGWDKQFDTVLFLGVFYHLRYPLLGLDIVSRLTGKRLVFQVVAAAGHVHPPAEERGAKGDGLLLRIELLDLHRIGHAHHRQAPFAPGVGAFVGVGVSREVFGVHAGAELLAIDLDGV
ncbi:MAG: methyltransferase domain-containing protein, partial [Desulfovibrionales bacterium]